MLEGKDPVFTNTTPGVLYIAWPLKSFNKTLVMDIDERKIKMDIPGEKSFNWFLNLTTALAANLPFNKISPHLVNCSFQNMSYTVTTTKGIFSTPNDSTV